jgi:hypothetical protein
MTYQVSAFPCVCICLLPFVGGRIGGRGGGNTVHAMCHSKHCTRGTLLSSPHTHYASDPLHVHTTALQMYCQEAVF